MEPVKILTKEQKIILEEFRKDEFLKSHFYFTGGTALSLYYLKHRYSVDLDFFSENKFDPQIIFGKLYVWGEKYTFKTQLKSIEDTYSYNLTFPHRKSLKVDFAHYPYKRVAKSRIFGGIEVDSLTDMAINKLTTVIQRTEVKDFVDLYYLLDKYTVWDLIYGVEAKFRMEIDPIFLGSDFLKVKDFDFLPKMIKPLTLPTLKDFFVKKAKLIANRAVKK